jgi:hypothetical protein
MSQSRDHSPVPAAADAAEEPTGSSLTEPEPPDSEIWGPPSFGHAIAVNVQTLSGGELVVWIREHCFVSCLQAAVGQKLSRAPELIRLACGAAPLQDEHASLPRAGITHQASVMAWVSPLPVTVRRALTVQELPLRLEDFDMTWRQLTQLAIALPWDTPLQGRPQLRMRRGPVSGDSPLRDMCLLADQVLPLLE